jgi:hypothetical protein
MLAAAQPSVVLHAADRLLPPGPGDKVGEMQATRGTSIGMMRDSLSDHQHPATTEYQLSLSDRPQ